MNEASRRALANYLEARTPASSRETAAWEAIERRVSAGDQGPGLVDDAVVGGGKLGVAGKGILIGLVVVGAGLGAWALAGDDAGRPPPTPLAVEESEVPPMPRTPTLAPAVPPAEDPPPSREAETEAAGATSDDSESRGRPQAARGNRRVRGGGTKGAARSRNDAQGGHDDAVEEADSSSLAEEMKLLARGQRALKRGDATAALRAFDEHARRYPNGALVDERRVQRAQTLCALGKTAEARKAAHAFVRDAPNSPHAGKASRICREDAP